MTSTLNKFNTSATLNLTSKQDLLTTEPFPTANQTANRTVFTPNLSIVRPTPTVADVVQNLTEGETETTDEITKATTTGGRPKSGGLSVVPPSGVTRPNVPAVVGTQVVLVEAPQVDIVTQKTKRPDTASSIDQSNIDFNEKPGKPTQFVGKNNSKTPDVSCKCSCYCR